MFLLVLPILLIYFAINAFIAFKFSDVAHMKGYGSEMHCFALCFWLGIFGCIYVSALPDRSTREVQNNTGTHFIHAKSNNLNTKFINDDSSDFKKYDAIVKKAEKFKDTFFDHDYRIRVYESIVKEMQLLADVNFLDASQKLEEYKLHLELLKTKKLNKNIKIYKCGKPLHRNAPTNLNFHTLLSEKIASADMSSADAIKLIRNSYPRELPDHKSFRR